MPIIKAAPGENINEVVSFTDELDSPVLDISTVRFLVYVDGNVVVNSTSATPDPSDPSIYTINFTLPAATPYSEGDDLAKLVVMGVDSAGQIYKHTQYFQVANTGDESTENEEQDSVVGTTDSGFTVRFVIPYDLNPAVVRFTLYNDNSAPISALSLSDMTTFTQGGKKIYEYTFPDGHGLTPSNSIQGSYLGKWYASGGNLSDPIASMVSVFILNNTALMLIRDMRATMDRANIQHIHPYLSWSVEDFALHLFRGFDKVNGTGPIITNFSINNPLPIGLTHYIVKASIISALQSQYQAENASNFNFQGLGVQLDVDRLPGLDNLINQLQSELDKLPDDKRTWNQNGQPAGDTANATTNGGAQISVGIVISEGTNYLIPNHWDNGYLHRNPRVYGTNSRILRRRS